MLVQIHCHFTGVRVETDHGEASTAFFVEADEVILVFIALRGISDLVWPLHS